MYKSILSTSQFCIPYLLYLIANPKVSIIFWNIDTRAIGVFACENETDWKSDGCFANCNTLRQIWNAEPWIMGISVIGWKLKLLQKVIVGFLLYFGEKAYPLEIIHNHQMPCVFLAELDTSIALHKEL